MNCVSKLNCFEAEFHMSRKRMKNRLQETQSLLGLIHSVMLQNRVSNQEHSCVIINKCLRIKLRKGEGAEGEHSFLSLDCECSVFSCLNLQMWHHLYHDGL